MTTGSDRARKRSLVHLHEPAIRIDRLGNRRQQWKCWAGHPRGLVATGARLVGPFLVVMGQVRGSSFRNLCKSAWQVGLQALLSKRAVESLDNSLDAIDKTAHTLPEDWWE
jgi:hypothetical protein